MTKMSKYVVLCETNGEEFEQWLYFIKLDGNETELKYLYDQLEKVEKVILDDLSMFDLDLENPVSEQTAKEMTMIDYNSYQYHRKFDGKLQLIDLKLRKKDDSERMIEKVHNKLAYGDISKFIDKEDKNGREEEEEEESDDNEDDALVPLPTTNSRLLPPQLQKLAVTE